MQDAVEYRLFMVPVGGAQWHLDRVNMWFHVPQKKRRVEWLCECVGGVGAPLDVVHFYFSCL